MRKFAASFLLVSACLFPIASASAAESGSCNNEQGDIHETVLGTEYGVDHPGSNHYYVVCLGEGHDYGVDLDNGSGGTCLAVVVNSRQILC